MKNTSNRFSDDLAHASAKTESYCVGDSSCRMSKHSIKQDAQAPPKAMHSLDATNADKYFKNCLLDNLNLRQTKFTDEVDR